MRRLFLFITLLIAGRATAQQSYTTVFESGQDGYKSYRIPAMIALPDGKLLAFAEGRVGHAGDFGDIDIVMKVSADKGKTWGPLQKVAEFDSLQAGNPAPVVDLADPMYPKGRVFLFYNTGNNHEGEVRKGKGLRECWYITSADGGASWAAPVNITAQVHRPAAAPYQFKEDWRSYANTPGHAVQLSGGRIFVAANHSEGPLQQHAKDYRAHGYYSDDHGKTFKLSETITYPGGNEAMAAQLKDGRLMMNFRNQQGDVKARLIALSSNGGESWDTVYADRQLPDPVCQGSILRMKKLLLVCNNADTVQRNNLTLRISKNDGKSFYKSIPVAVAPDAASRNSYSAYSDIAPVGKKHVGVLFEKSNYKTIVFTAIRL